MPALPDTVFKASDQQPRLWGNLTSDWLTSTDGLTQAKINFTHELGTNTIVYVNSVASFRSTSGQTVSTYRMINDSINGNRATVHIEYTLQGSSQTYLCTVQLVV